jgi:DNA-binding PadR family transcriptional regulator
MALSHAILALLLDNPCSGYDLAKDFDQSVNFFWKATHQQIYRELGKLEEQDWVTAEVIAQTGKPDRKLYSITSQGKQHLAEWLLQPCEVMSIKEDLLVKLWAAKLLSVADLIEPSMSIAALIEEFQRHRQFHVEKLNTFLNIEQEFYAQPETLSISNKYRYLVLRRGIRYEEDYIGWCDEVLELFSSHSGA